MARNATKKDNRIVEYRNPETGEVEICDRIGETIGGKRLFFPIVGFVPINAAGHAVRVRLDRDGNWIEQV